MENKPFRFTEFDSMARSSSSDHARGKPPVVVCCAMFMIEEDVAIMANQCCARATRLVGDSEVVVILRSNEPLPELEHMATLGVVPPIVASTAMLVPGEDDTVIPHKELADACRDLANHKVVVVACTNEPVSKTNIVACLAVVPPAVRSSPNTMTAPPARVFSDQELRGVVVVMVNVVDVEMSTATIANVPVIELHSDPLCLPRNSVAFPIYTESFAILVASIRPAVTTAVTLILEHPAMVSTTGVEISTRNLVNRDAVVHVMVGMREVPALVSPTLTTIVLVVRMIEHRNHVVPLACRVCIDTGGHASERNTHKGLAAHPHGLAGTVRVLIFVIVVAPAMCSTSVVQRPASV